MRRVGLFVLAVVAVLGMVSPVSAAGTPQVTDPCGDASVLVSVDGEEVRPTAGVSDHVDVRSVTFDGSTPDVVDVTLDLCAPAKTSGERPTYVMAWSAGACDYQLVLQDQYLLAAGSDEELHRELVSLQGCGDDIELDYASAVTFAGQSITVRLTRAALGGYGGLLDPGTVWDTTRAVARDAVSMQGGNGGVIERVSWESREGYDETENGAAFVIPKRP